MTCPECGTELLPRARFCHQCGWDSKLAAAGAASSTAGQRPRWKRWLMGVCLGFASLLIFTILVTPRGSAEPTLMVGQAAPDFDLAALDGSRVQLSALKGQPLVLNFWASWCVPCRREMPHFQAVYERHQGAGLQVYGVNLGESRVAVADFQNRVGFDFPVLLDIEEKAQDSYRILPIPATFFIDKDGIIRGIYQFQMSEAQIEQEVLQLLSR